MVCGYAAIMRCLRHMSHDVSNVLMQFFKGILSGGVGRCRQIAVIDRGLSQDVPGVSAPSYGGCLPPDQPPGLSHPGGEGGGETGGSASDPICGRGGRRPHGEAPSRAHRGQADQGRFLVSSFWAAAGFTS